MNGRAPVMLPQRAGWQIDVLVPMPGPAAPAGVRYLGRREAAIHSWQDDTLEQITTFSLRG